MNDYRVDQILHRCQAGASLSSGSDRFGFRMASVLLLALIMSGMFSASVRAAERKSEVSPDSSPSIHPSISAVAGPWDLRSLAQAPSVYLAEGFTAPGMEALFYEGHSYRGCPTRIFAWMGIPKGQDGRKVPGMVLVHGGGGTAFEEWVRLWNERGYAAIAMDTCGCTPGGNHGVRPRHAMGGPPGWGGFNQIDEIQSDQWTYHAVAAVILAHSLLRAQSQVDPDRIGLTGISWGGYLTCIVAGVDTRFKFAVPVYGCGFYGDTVFKGSLAQLGDERSAQWLSWWDPSNYLVNAPMPILWVTGSNDFAYPMDALQKSYRLPKSRRDLCIRLRMPHGHGGAGESPREIHVFADHHCKSTGSLARIRACGRQANEVWVEFASVRPIVKAELNFTCDLGEWQKRQWDSMQAKVDKDRVTAILPSGATVYYFNLMDDRDCVVSTEHEVLKPMKAH